MTGRESSGARLFPAPCVAVHSTTPRSRILQLFELKELLIGKKQIQLATRGISMYPLVHPGDLFTISFRHVNEIAIGDIVVYRRQERLFGHRAIAKGIREGREYVVTRADAAMQGHDGPSFDEDILGVVAQITRKGASVPVAPRAARPVSLWAAAYRSCLRLAWQAAGQGRRMLALAQQYPLYGYLARRWCAIRAPIAVSLGSRPVGATPSRFWRKAPPEESLDPDLQWRLIAHVGSKEVGGITLGAFAGAGVRSRWAITEVSLPLRYRARGIEEALFKKADQLFARAGIPELWAYVARGARRDCAFLHILGFREYPAESDAGRLTMKRDVVV